MKKRLSVLLVLAVLSASVVVAEEANNEALLQRMKVLAANPDEAKTAEDAKFLNDMAIEVYKAGKYAQAEPLYQRSLAIREKVLGQDHSYVAQSLNNLALLYNAQGKYDQAEPLYQRSLAIREKALGQEHLDVARSLNNLAELYYAQGKYELAEPLHQRSLAIREKALEQNHPDVAQSLRNLALLYYAQGKYELAESLFQRSLAIQEEKLGKDHPEVGHTLYGLALLYRDQSKYEQAESFFRRSLAIKEKALGEDHPDVAWVLNSFATLYKEQKKYEQAESLWKRCLAIQEKAFGKDHIATKNTRTSLETLRDTSESLQAKIKDLDTAMQLSQQGFALSYQGKYEQAEPLLKEALAIFEKVHGKDHPTLALILDSIAGGYREAGKFDQAESMYVRGLAIMEKNFDKDHPDITKYLDSLASNYDSQTKYEQAKALHLRSLAIREKAFGKDNPAIVESLDNLAILYQNQGKYNEVEPLLKKGLAIREKALGQDHPDVAKSLLKLSTLYQVQGKYELAEPLLIRIVAIAEKTLVKDNPDASAQMKKAMADISLGKTNPEILVQMDNINFFAVSTNNLAALYEKQGKYREAEPLYQRCLKIAKEMMGGEDNQIVAVVLGNLAGNYDTQGKDEEAESKYLQSLEIYKKLLGENHPEFAKTLNNLAMLYDKQAKYQQAEPLFLKSLAIFKEALGQDHPNVGKVLGHLAKHYNMQGKYEQAEPLFLQSLAIKEKALGKDHPDVAKGLNDLAKFYVAQDTPNKAEPLLQRSLRLMNRVLDHWLWGAGEQTRQAYMQQEEGNRNAYLSFYTLANTPDQALHFSLSRKNLLLRIAAEASSLAKHSHDPAIQKQKQAFDDVRTQLATLAFSGKADKTQIQALEEQANQLEMQLSQKVAGFKRGKTDVTTKAVIKRLTNQQVLIDFLVYWELNFKTQKLKTEQVIVLIADAKNGVKLIKLGDLAPITEALKNYHANIVPTDTNANTRESVLKQSGQTLYAQLWQPLIPYLKNKNTVYLVPDGELHLLPFKALQDAQGTYLASQQQLITLSSARDLVLPPLTGKTEKSAIFADPDYGNTETSNTGAVALKAIAFSPLPNTSKEAEQIHSLLNKKSPTSLFVQKQATEQAVKDLNTPKILHLATHGFFLEQQKPDPKTLEHNLNRSVLDLPQARVENPLTRSGLAFVNANLSIHDNTQTDGILTALEVLNLKLEGTDLVVLSACETGKGDIKTGESVYSLNRAFQEVGAKAVLSTLWEIDDAATVEFMQKFYTRFLDGQSAQHALQDTQHEFMQHEKYKDPFYWAGFVVTGKN